MTPHGPFWTLPGEDALTSARALADQRDGAILTVSTTISSLSSLRLGSPDEDALLRRAWEVTVSHLPRNVTGKRLNWRGFLFVLPGAAEDSRRTAGAVLHALREDPPLTRLAWRVVAAPIGTDWQAAFEAAQPDAHPDLAKLDVSVAAWVEPTAVKYPVTILPTPN